MFQDGAGRLGDVRAVAGANSQHLASYVSNHASTPPKLQPSHSRHQAWLLLFQRVKSPIQDNLALA
jgi:hypothetical protein